MIELNRTVEKLTAETGEAAIQKLQDEIKDCKAILKCGVCFDRPKEVSFMCPSFANLLYNHIKSNTGNILIFLFCLRNHYR